MAEAVELSGEARFELKRQLADTLQGRIYSAIDRKTGEFVVVKETWKQLVKLGKSRDGHSVPENFEEEKKILKYLSSQKDADQGFVRLIDEWEDKDCFLYAMEMCRGGELFEYIKGMHSDGAVAHFTRQQARLKQEEMKEANDWIKAVQHMFKQIVECTAWMHSKGVCHLDMSLENSMIASRSKKHGNQVKLIDFGLAVYYPNNKFVNNKRVGKTGYMAPEVYSRKKYDPRAADIWSLGVMLFMMLIGAPPYQIPSGSNPAFNFIVNGRLRDVLKHWKRLRLVNKDALDLMNKIFKYEAKRIKMEEILKHPFLQIADKNKIQQKEKEKVTNESSAPSKKEQSSASQQQPSPPQQQQKPSSSPPQAQPQPQPQQQQQPQPQQQDDNPSTKQEQQKTVKVEVSVKNEQQTKPKQAEEDKQDINSYPFRSEVAKKFVKQLASDLHRDQLTNILKEVEQTHNSMQQKLKRQRSAGNGNNLNNNLPETCKELAFIYKNVEKRLDCYTQQAQQTNNKKVSLERHSPHNN